MRRQGKSKNRGQDTHGQLSLCPINEIIINLRLGSRIKMVFKNVLR